MKNWFLHILLLAGLFGVLTTSCSQEEGLEPQVTKEKVQVSFSIELDTPTARSRANNKWGDNYDDNANNNYLSDSGNSFENAINPNQFHVEIKMIDEEGVNVETYSVQKISIFPSTNNNIYNFVGERSERAHV